MGQLPRCPICDSVEDVDSTDSPLRYYCSHCDKSFDIEESPDAPRVEITTTYYPDTSEKTVTLGDFHAMRQRLTTLENSLMQTFAVGEESRPFLATLVAQQAGIMRARIRTLESEIVPLYQRAAKTMISMMREEIRRRQSELEQLEQLLNTAQKA